MNVHVVVYNKHTGKINLISYCPEVLAELQAQNGDAFLFGTADMRLDYVNTAVTPHAVTLRPDMVFTGSLDNIVADGSSSNVLNNLPDPCVITYAGPGFKFTSEVTGGTAEFTTDVAGTHTVKIVAFPYLDWEGTFNAV